MLETSKYLLNGNGNDVHNYNNGTVGANLSYTTDKQGNTNSALQMDSTYNQGLQVAGLKEANGVFSFSIICTYHDGILNAGGHNIAGFQDNFAPDWGFVTFASDNSLIIQTRDRGHSYNYPQSATPIQSLTDGDWCRLTASFRRLTTTTCNLLLSINNEILVNVTLSGDTVPLTSEDFGFGGVWSKANGINYIINGRYNGKVSKGEYFNNKYLTEFEHLWLANESQLLGDY
jgi:hypothetical protein